MSVNISEFYRKPIINGIQFNSSWIDLQKVRFSYNQRIDIIYDVSLRINKGQFVGIVGPNGSGKSTLARLINGGVLPQYGDVMVNGLNTRQSENLPIIKRLVNIVHADAENQLITSTVFDEVSFALQAMRLDKREIPSRVDLALKIFDLVKFRDRHPFYLSVGEQFRLLLAAALVRNPMYIILDEVLAMLDSYSREYILQMLLDLRKELDLGVILLTHRLSDLVNADRIAVLNSGRIILDDTVTNVFSSLREKDTQYFEPPPIL